MVAGIKRSGGACGQPSQPTAPAGGTPNLANLDPELLQRAAGHDPGNEHSVVYMWGTTGIGYDVAKVKAIMPDAPVDSWSLVLDPGETIHLKARAIGRQRNGTDKTARELSAVAIRSAAEITYDLASGTITINGKPVQRGSSDIGYIPQHRSTDSNTPMRARDLLRLGFDGHRWGLPLPSRKVTERVNHVLDCIDGHDLADQPIGNLSGGQLQRFRVGQAVIGSPDLILADEPLSALDLHQQQAVANLIDEERREHEAAVLFVTHDVNPILGMVDRVLYLANGRFRIGTPDEVLRSEVLSELYGTQVDVVRNQGRIVVVGLSDHEHHPDEEWV